MDVTKTNYGLLVTIPEQHDNNGELLNSKFAYQLRQVRTINDNDPEEQPLINALEKGEKRDTAKFLKLAEDMKTMKTKTPQQMHEQWQRIKAYVRERGQFIKYVHIMARYCNRMADYNGAAPYWHGRYYYDERNNAPVPASVYAKQV